MAGKSLISTMRHGKFGNVDYALGLTMLVGTVVGVEIGAQMVMWLERIGSVDKVVRWLYVVLLVLLAWLVFHDVACAAEGRWPRLTSRNWTRPPWVWTGPPSSRPSCSPVALKR